MTPSNSPGVTPFRTASKGLEVRLVLDMSPIGSLHAALVAALSDYLGRLAAGRLTVWSQNPIRLDGSSEPQPDIALVKPRPDFYAAAHPGPADTLLVIEVAESSLAYDLGVKVPLYARHGIPEVWVIDAATRTTHRFLKPRPEGYSEQGMITLEEPLACLALPGEAKNLATILPLGRSERV
jgi:Uma2 family endonuclease